MTVREIATSFSLLILLVASPTAVASTACPSTVGSDNEYVDGWPHTDTWFGSKNLAIILPESGTWPTTKPGHLISVKLFWYVEGYEPGREDEFKTTIRRLDDGQNDAVFSKPTNAGGPSLGAWTILTGVDFPSEGCWEITAEFQGKSLAFVVKTVTPAYRRKDAAKQIAALAAGRFSASCLSRFLQLL